MFCCGFRAIPRGAGGDRGGVGGGGGGGGGVTGWGLETPPGHPARFHDPHLIPEE